MTYTTTWTFNNTYEGFDFLEILTHGVGSATRTKVAGGVRNTVVIPSGGADKEVIGRNTSSDYSGIMHDAEAGDKLELDYSACSDAVIYALTLRAIYDDTTSNSSLIVATPAGTITRNLTVGKRLKYIEFDMHNLSSIGINHYRDVIELRLITQTPVGAIAGMLKTPASLGFSDGNIASILANGDHIFLAVFDDSNFPVLIKMSSSLTTDGTYSFTPNVGNRIGVQCSKSDADNVWIAGQFDGTDTVEKSENAGGSWAVKDDGTIGEVHAFDVGPDSDERVLVFDGDNNDIIETTDDGTNWTTINSAIGFLVNSIARFSLNILRCVFGNPSAVSDNIDYSVNTGVNLEDYSTGFPQVDVTKVITK